MFYTILFVLFLGQEIRYIRKTGTEAQVTIYCLLGGWLVCT